MNDLTPVEDTPEDLTDATEVEVVDDAQADEPDEIAVLRAEIETLKQDKKVIEDLRRSVGRVQSLADKFSAASNDTQRADIQRQINEKFATLDGQIGEIVGALDETSIDPATRQRIIEAQRASREAARVQQAVDEAIAKRTPAPVPQQDFSPLETELVSTIEAAGLDPDDDRFNWQEMSRLLAADRSGRMVRAHVLGKILEAKTEEDAATRRTTAKTQAGGGAPKPAAVGAQVTSMDDADAAWGRGELGIDQYRKYREQFGVSLRPGGGR